MRLSPSPPCGRKLDRLELKLQRTYANKDYLFREMIVRMHTRARMHARTHTQARADGDEMIGYKRRRSLRRDWP